MTLPEDLSKVNTLFIDTAPIIYFIEAHPKYGQISKEIVTFFQSEDVEAYTTVLTLTEVLPAPISSDNKKLAQKFTDFFRSGKNFNLIDISDQIAERAGKLRGQHQSLRTIDAIQISAAIEMSVDVFITNDKKLKKLNNLIEILVLDDYIKTKK